VNCQFVAQIAPRASCFDGVHVAEDVCNRDVRRGEFFHEARVARQPCDWCGVAAIGNQVPAGTAQRREWIVVNLASGNVGNFHVQEINQAAQDAALGLASQTQEDEIMTPQNRIGDLRQNGILISMNAGKKRLSGLELLQKVRAEFSLTVRRVAPGA